MPRPEIEQDRRTLADDRLAVLEKRRREGRMLRVVHHPHHHGEPLGFPRHVDIVGSGLLERQAHEFAAPLDGRPVVEFVRHAARPAMV
jgi:hypothetical protein